MPISFSYDIEGAEPIDHNRLQSIFERFGWENIGGSSFRYPPLPRLVKGKFITKGIPDREDWLNSVIPALMCFRAFVLKRKLKLTKHSIDAQASTGSHGQQPRNGAKIELKETGAVQFGEKNLRDWVTSVTDAIPSHYA